MVCEESRLYTDILFIGSHEGKVGIRQCAMSAASTAFRGARPILRSQFTAAHARRQASNRFRANFGPNARRFQSTAADAEATAKASWFKRMWDSPVGLKTVHFWAPVMKWALVLAGISDFARPAEKLSLTQNGALTATGLIWTRWCLIIKPKNYLLAAVNFFLGLVGVVQVSRILVHRSAQKSLPEQVGAKAAEVVKA
ncbi:hypothetical protein P8C59_009404 [Phyllachora maydis]|uniref:Mitochondrial pyruvate carrier n=1 Tax=Phyllachora maydis TaxID=1825666 RepID=A0AAD9ICK4_9PEZI|nr:hypothetical protein P8C59_009404 [Phyllachora maydis]